MVSISKQYDRGAVHGSVIAVICLGLLFALASAAAAWAYANYQEQKTNVEGKIQVAVAEAKKIQAEEDEVKFSEREAQPYRQFVGPDDLGRVTFDYSKLWSVYISTGDSTSNYQAYLHPRVVPQIKNDKKYALRVKIEQESYEEYIKSFDDQVKDGDLKTSVIKVGTSSGTRFDGKINKETRGAFVVFKIRDKVLTIQTDADIFMADFNRLVQTIKFES